MNYLSNVNLEIIESGVETYFEYSSDFHHRSNTLNLE